MKNGLDRYVVLNRIAKSVIEGCRGEHAEFVFTRDGSPDREDQQFGMEGGTPSRGEALCGASSGDRARLDFGPSGFTISNIRTDIRLRAVGVGFEDRKLLLGHKSDHVTTHYSAPEIGALIAGLGEGVRVGSRKSPALAIVRARRKRPSD